MIVPTAPFFGYDVKNVLLWTHENNSTVLFSGLTIK
jgi:hypothetical protein